MMYTTLNDSSEEEEEEEEDATSESAIRLPTAFLDMKCCFWLEPSLRQRGFYNYKLTIFPRILRAHRHVLCAPPRARYVFLNGRSVSHLFSSGPYALRCHDQHGNRPYCASRLTLSHQNTIEIDRMEGPAPSDILREPLLEFFHSQARVEGKLRCLVLKISKEKRVTHFDQCTVCGLRLFD